MQVSWVKCSDNWCGLKTVKLDKVTASGVYVIWTQRGYVYVGKGDIADRLQDHRNPESETGKRILPYGRGQAVRDVGYRRERLSGRRRGIPDQYTEASREQAEADC